MNILFHLAKYIRHYRRLDFVPLQDNVEVLILVSMNVTLFGNGVFADEVK